jgi:hypothetical protein
VLSPVTLLAALDTNLAKKQGEEEANVVGHKQQPAGTPQSTFSNHLKQKP